MADDRLFRNNDNLVEWLGATNEATGEYLNLAVCTFSVFDEAGELVTDAEDVSMSHPEGSNGDYVGTLDAAIAATLVRDAVYWVVITLIEGELQGQMRRRCVAVDRD